MRRSKATIYTTNFALDGESEGHSLGQDDFPLVIPGNYNSNLRPFAIKRMHPIIVTLL